jgi:GNAT superfamily N-acetyltransferase
VFELHEGRFTLVVMGRIVLRERRPEDAPGIVRLSIESSAFYSKLAPELFTLAEEEGFVEWLNHDVEWLAKPTSFARVAEVDGAVAGYLEASVQQPDEAARFNGNRDLRERRLFINYVITAEAHKRTGVATALVEAAEAWGREHGATVALCDTYYDSPQSVPFWEQRMGYGRRGIIFRKPL